MIRHLQKAAVVFLLVLTLCAGLGCAKTQDGARKIAGYTLEPGEGTYAYVIHTPHATWHLAAADIELLGEEAFFEGLERILKDQDADFADAIAALDGYLTEVPVIDIYTDLSGRTELARSGAYSAYCRWGIPVPSIELYQAERAQDTLLHEYVHYLTHRCFPFEVDGNFWSEAIAEYVSRMICQNRMARSAYAEQGREMLASYGLTDANGDPDLKKIYCWYSKLIRSGGLIGMRYSAVSQAPMEMTQQLFEHPMLTTLSYYEACCFFDWLVERYGKELVFEHMTIGQRDFRDVFGEDFETLFFKWAADNDAWCVENGIRLSPGEE